MPQLTVEMDGAEEQADWDDDGDGIALSEIGYGYGAGSVVDSPTETLGSLESFPFGGESGELTPTASRGGGGGEDAGAPLARPQASTSLPPPSGRNSLALPTLLEHRTISHTSSYHTAHTEPDDDDSATPSASSSGPPTPTGPPPRPSTGAINATDTPLHRSSSASTVLTLDAPHPSASSPRHKAHRRDARSDFSGAPRKLRDLRPRDVHQAVNKQASRHARRPRGAVTEVGEVGEIERALERAGMGVKEEERKEWVYLVEHQRG